MVGQILFLASSSLFVLVLLSAGGGGIDCGGLHGISGVRLAAGPHELAFVGGDVSLRVERLWLPIRLPLRLRGGERVREGHVSKITTRTSEGKKKSRLPETETSERDSKNKSENREKKTKSGRALRLREVVVDGGGDHDRERAGDKKKSGGTGEDEELQEEMRKEGAGEERKTSEERGEGGDGDGPKLRFGGDFASDFPNRRRLDDLYAEAQIYKDQDIGEESSDMEQESSGDKQGNNPFEYYTRKPLAEAALQTELLALLKDCHSRQQIKKAVNEVMKSIARNTAEFVILAADTEPVEILLQIPMMCEDKGIPFVWVQSRDELGTAAGLRGATGAAAIISDPRSPLMARIMQMKARIDMLGIQLAQNANPGFLEEIDDPLDAARKAVL